MIRIVRSIAALVLAAATIVLTGCAATQVDATWFNDAYAGRKLAGKMLVVAVTRDATVRRLYEDEMQAQLTARGVDAVRSYETHPAPLKSADAAALMQVAQGTGASRILASALVAHQYVREVRVDPMPTWRWDYFGWYHYYWPYGYARTEVYEYDRYLVSTTLTDAANGKIVWSARTRTDAPGRVEREIKGFVAAIVGALERGGLL